MSLEGGSAPLRAFAELRWRLGLRRFLSRKGIPELVARVVVFAIAGLAALVFAGAVAAGTWRAARLGRGLATELAVSAVFFGVWQTWTAVALTLAERDTLDLRRFLLYPLPPGRLYAYALFASAAGDPFALFWTVMLGGAFVGAALGRPGGWLAAFAVAIPLFMAATVVYIALLQGLLARLVRVRRAREVAIVVAYLAVVLLVAWMAAGSRRPIADLRAPLARLQWLAWPAALAAAAARRLFTGQVLGALAPLAGLAAGAVVTGWLAFRLALADALSGDEAPRGRESGGAAWGGIEARWLGPTLGTLVEKERLYLLRHPLALVMVVVIPAIAALVAWRALPHVGQEAGEVVTALPLFGFALYAHVVTQPFWLNAFGWDRGGARLLFLAPIEIRDVLVAKNLATGSFAAIVFAACAVAIVAVAGPPPGWALAGGFALHLGLAPWLYAAGNVVTSANPIGAGFTLERGSRLPMLSGLVGMGITSVVAGGFALPVVAAVKLDAGWLLPPAWALLGLLGLAVYRRALPASGRYAARRREEILAAVCAEEE